MFSKGKWEKKKYSNTCFSDHLYYANKLVKLIIISIHIAFHIN
jgi:hypothetical protein